MGIVSRFFARLGLNNNGNTITNVANPVNDQDAATKNYALARSGDTASGTIILPGSNTAQAAKVRSITEMASITAAAPTAVQNLYVANGAVQYYTVNATNNWIINIEWSPTLLMTDVMAVGDSITVALMSNMGLVAYKPSAIRIDNTLVTVKWQGGSAPLLGNALSTDIYTITVLKTAYAAFSVFAAQTQYK